MPWTRISGRLFGHGGKLLQYHGWNDTLIAPKNSLNYYTSVADALGGANKVNDSYRLFTVPGMALPRRRRYGSLRRDQRDGAMGGKNRKAPESIIAPRYANDKPDRTRPLCPYPQVAAYKGIGSTDDAAIFMYRDHGPWFSRRCGRTCSAPAGSQLVRIPGLQARPLGGGTPISTGNLVAIPPFWPGGRRVLPRLLPPVDG